MEIKWCKACGKRTEHEMTDFDPEARTEIWECQECGNEKRVLPTEEEQRG